MVRQEARSRVHVIRAAVRAWHAGRPHVALEIMTDAGYGAYWPVFQRTVLRHARRRFLARMRG